MIAPNVLAQLGFVAVFIAATVHLGNAVSNFQVPDPQIADGAVNQEAQERLYALKLYMALSIVALILSLLSFIVIVLCFIRVFKTRNDVVPEKHENGNGY